MTDEDRLRNALEARGDAVRPDTRAWDAIDDRRQPVHGRHRPILAIAAVVAVLALIGGALAWGGGDDSTEEVVAGSTVPASATPSDTAIVMATADGEIVRSDLDDPGQREVVATMDDDTTILDLTVDRAGTDVYLSTLTEGDCLPVISRLDGGDLVRVTDGFQVAVAGSTMAYVPFEEAFCMGRPWGELPPGWSAVSSDLVTRNLADGTETRWPAPPSADSMVAQNPTVAADGSRVAYALATDEGCVTGAQCAPVDMDPSQLDSAVLVIDPTNQLESQFQGIALSPEGFGRLRHPVFRGPNILAIGSGLVGLGGELAAFDVNSPPFEPYPKLDLALPTWTEPARHPVEVDVLGNRLLTIITDPETGDLQLWSQGLTDGNAPVLVADEVIDAAFAFPLAGDRSDPTTTTLVPTTVEPTTDTTAGPPVTTDPTPTTQVEDRCRPTWATPPEGRPELVLEVTSPLRPGALVPFHLDVSTESGQVMWGDDWTLQRASPRPGQATGELWTAIHALTGVFGENPGYGPVESLYSDDGFTQTVGAVRLPPDLEPGWYQIIAVGSRVPEGGPPATSIAAIATFSVGPC